MADITMCRGDDCPLKNNCHRYTANASEYRQSYFVDPPYVDDECDYFWGIENSTVMKSLNDIFKER